VAGLGTGGSVPIVYSYAFEFLPDNKLLMLIYWFSLAGSFGSAVVAKIVLPDDLILNRFDSWRVFLLVTCVPILFSLLFSFFVPKSPKWMEEPKVQETSAIRTTNLITEESPLNPFLSIASDTSFTFTNKKVVTSKVIYLSFIWFFISLGYFGLNMFLPDFVKDSLCNFTNDVYMELIIVRCFILIGNILSWKGLEQDYAIPIFLLFGILASAVIGGLLHFFESQNDLTVSVIIFVFLCFLVMFVSAALGKLTIQSVNAFPSNRAMSLGFLMLCGRIGACIEAAILGHYSHVYYVTWPLTVISFIVTIILDTLNRKKRDPMYT